MGGRDYASPNACKPLLFCANRCRKCAIPSGTNVTVAYVEELTKYHLGTFVRARITSPFEGWISIKEGDEEILKPAPVTTAKPATLSTKIPDGGALEPPEAGAGSPKGAAPT